MIRCVNIDWLEVFVFEVGEPHDEAYFQKKGFVTHAREYGTRIYKEMFVLDGSDGHAFIEVRRNPKNPLLPGNACHLRFVNRSCYFEHAADIMSQFLDRYGYDFQRISRIDICMDFTRFDDNTLPRIFMQRYMRGKFSKINQANIHSHGSDRWTGRVWNSVSWGSPTSMISTKFYNKTLELYDPRTDSYGKPYIRQSWLEAGLIDDLNRCTLHGVQQEVWRIEFAIRSAVKRWYVMELNGNAKHYYSVQNRLECYNTKQKLLTMFATLSQHYFHFKRYVMEQRKDRCPDRILFRWQGEQHVIVPEHPSTLSERTPDPALLVLIRKLRQYSEHTSDTEIRSQALHLLTSLERIQTNQELCHPYSYEERLAWQTLLRRRVEGEQSETLATILAELRDELNISKKAAIF